MDNLTEDKSSDTLHFGSPPNGAEHCLENKRVVTSEARNLKIMESMTLERLFKLASSDIQDQVQFCKGDRSYLREIDFIHGAYGLLYPLGINESAYHDAVSEMGQHLTTLCLLVVDANSDHPVTPVRNPGGLLRAMTRKHAAGKLNIAGEFDRVVRATKRALSGELTVYMQDKLFLPPFKIKNYLHDLDSM